MRTFFILALSTVLSACGSSDSSKSSGTEKVDALSVQTEKVTCTQTDVYVEKNNGKTNRYQEDSVTVTTQTVTQLSNGVKKLEKNGDWSVNVYWVPDNGAKEFVSKRGYTFVSTHEMTTTKTEDGLVKVTAKIVGTRTGKDGYLFTDKDGNKSPTNSYDYTMESISKVYGDTEVPVSAKIDGASVPVYNEVTQKTGNTERSTLRTPYTIKDGDWEVTMEKSDTLCRTEQVK